MTEITVDNSILQCVIQECERKAFFKYINHIVPKKPEAALKFGEAIHKVGDCLFSGKTVDEAVEMFRQAYPEDLDEKRTVAMGELITREYYKQYDGKQPFDRIIALEQGKSMDIVDEKHDRVIRFFGKLDKIVEWIYGITVIDHKTSSKYLTEFVQTLDVNHQFTGYIAILKTIYPEAFGLLVDAIYVPKPLKTKQPTCAFDRPIVTRSMQQIEEWKGWVKKGVNRLLRLQEFGRWDKFDNDCAKWNRVCPYYVVCQLPVGQQEALEMLLGDPDFEIRKWEPWNENNP